jgi:hypothetical protein
MPPSSLAAPSTHAFKSAGSATSIALPQAGRQRFHDSTDIVRVAGTNRDIRAFPGKQLGDRKPDTFAAAGYKRILSLQV